MNTYHARQMRYRLMIIGIVGILLGGGLPAAALKETASTTAPMSRDFHSYASMTTALQTIASDYPDIARLYDLGHSVQGRVLWGLKITDNPGLEEDEPEVRICGLRCA